MHTTYPFEIQLWTLRARFILGLFERFTIEKLRNSLLITAAAAVLLSFSKQFGIVFIISLQLFSTIYELRDIRLLSMRIEPVHICSQFSLFFLWTWLQLDVLILAAYFVCAIELSWLDDEEITSRLTGILIIQRQPDGTFKSSFNETWICLKCRASISLNELYDKD